MNQNWSKGSHQIKNGMSWLQPHWEPGVTIPELPIQNLIDMGIRAILLDVDGTLLPGKSTDVPQKVRDWVFEAKKDFSIHLISNNPSKKRISSVAEQLGGINFIYGAAKPRKHSLLKVLKQLGLKTNKIAIIGDRFFTDILVGNRIGLYTILVKPVHKSDQLINKKEIVQKIEKRISILLGANR